MFCDNCGSENSDGTKFCQKCGNQLIQDIHQEKISNISNQSADESFVDEKILTNDKSSENDCEKEFIFKSFKAGGTSTLAKLTQVICNKDFIKITRKYKPSSKKEPDEIINTQEVKATNYKLYINPVSLILSILVCIVLFIYAGAIYAILALAIIIIYCCQTKISIFTGNKTYTILCGMFGGRSQAKEFTDFITKGIK